MFCCVADDGKEDEADEGLGDAEVGDDGVDGVDEELGADGDHDGDDDEDGAGGPGGEELGLGFVAFLRFGVVEEFGVRFQLEEEVGDVDDEEDDRGAAGEDVEARVGVLFGSAEPGV